MRALVVQSVAPLHLRTRIKWHVALMRRKGRQGGEGSRMSLTQRGRALPDRRVLTVCPWRRKTSGTPPRSLLLDRNGEVV